MQVAIGIERSSEGRDTDHSSPAGIASDCKMPDDFGFWSAVMEGAAESKHRLASVLT